jgi:putative transcriptional regulator
MLQDMAIYNRLKILIAEKEFREGRKLTYRTISQETGISTATLVLYMKQGVKNIDTGTLERLCEYLNVQPGDLLMYSKDSPQDNKHPKQKTARK